MWRTAIVTTVAALFVAGSAMAFQCPSDIAAIDRALEGNTSLNAEQRAEVVALRDKGETEHIAGNHDASVATLAQAKEMLGIQ